MHTDIVNFHPTQYHLIRPTLPCLILRVLPTHTFSCENLGVDYVYNSIVYTFTHFLSLKIVDNLVHNMSEMYFIFLYPLSLKYNFLALLYTEYPFSQHIFHKVIWMHYFIIFFIIIIYIEHPLYASCVVGVSHVRFHYTSEEWQTLVFYVKTVK